MLNMEPSIKRGLTFWDRALLPRDEFEERLRIVRKAMQERNCRALVVSGNMYEDADLAYLVGVGVDGTLVLTLDDAPIIFTVSGSRESFFLRELTWIGQVVHRGYLIGAAVQDALTSRGIASGRIGTAGLQVLAKAPYEDLVGALSAYELHDVGPLLGTLREKLRPREIAAVRVALGMARKAADAARQVFDAGASNAAAVVEAERVARLQGAWDVRILANLDSDDLRPFERWSNDRRDALHLWVAARYQGYWADAIVTHRPDGGDEATAALAAMISASRTGTTAGEVAEAGLAILPAAARRSALAYGLGRGIGAAFDCRPLIAPDATEPLAEGTFLSFHVFARRAVGATFAGDIMQVSADGGRPVEPLERIGFGGLEA